MIRHSCIIFSCLVSLAIPRAVLASTLTRLGDFPVGLFNSDARGISGDGATVVGVGTILGIPSGEAAQWTTSGALSALRANVSDDGFERGASAASMDGSVIVGTITERFPLDTPIQEAFRWNVAEGVLGLGFLPGGSRSSSSDISDNGKVIVGTSKNSNASFQAFRWTNDSGMVSLGTLPTSNTAASNGAAISGDGSVIVGTSSSGNTQEAFRWTKETGMIGLGDLSGGVFGSSAGGVSTDGSVIVGSGSSVLSQGNLEAFRWTAATGMQGLGFLHPTDISSSAGLVSSGGRLVFGSSLHFLNNQLVNSSFVWDLINGMRDLVHVLENEFSLAGDLAGWTDLVARDISDDGLALVGGGTNPDGNSEAWLIQLDHPIGIPEPSTALLLLVASMIWIKPRRRTT